MVNLLSASEARLIADKAWALMERYDVPPIPDNYQVWYGYVSGGNPALVRAVDILISNGDDFSQSRCRELFHQFFAPDDKGREVAGTARAVQRQIERILDFVAETSDAGQYYDASLKEFSGELDGDMSADHIKSLLGGVIEQTERMLISNARLKQELEESTREINILRQSLTTARMESQTDVLTGLANRKLFQKNLRRAAIYSMERGDDLSLIMLDVDNFKSFNDKWGHLLGDQVLKHIAAMLKQQITEVDTAARFGGEEFVVLLPRRGLAEAVSIANRLRMEISAREAKKRGTGETVGRITCSFGVSQFCRGEPLAEFISRADTALYDAKRRGRNCVVDESQRDTAADEDRVSVA